MPWKVAAHPSCLFGPTWEEGKNTLSGVGGWLDFPPAPAQEKACLQGRKFLKTPDVGRDEASSPCGRLEEKELCISISFYLFRKEGEENFRKGGGMSSFASKKEEEAGGKHCCILQAPRRHPPACKHTHAALQA